MSVLSYDEAGRFLEKKGLEAVDDDTWMGLHQIGTQAFRVHVRLAEAFVQVAIMQNLFTLCNQPPLHQYITETNSHVTVGKFAVGPTDEDEGGSRPLILLTELPAGTRDAYTSETEIAMLLHFAFELVEEHRAQLQELVGQSCDSSADRGPGGRGLIDRLRAFRQRERQ